MATLTTGQLDTLKTWLTANASGLDDEQAAALLNATASGPATGDSTYRAWKTSIDRHGITDEADVNTDGTSPTTFVWGGTLNGSYINRSQAERDAWRELMNDGGTRPDLANVRTAFADIFSGIGAGAVACRDHIWARGQRACSNGEKVFTVQTVGGPTQTGSRGARTNPDTLVVEGPFTVTNVSDARNRP